MIDFYPLLMIEWRDDELHVVRGVESVLIVLYSPDYKTRQEKLEFLHAVVLEALNTPDLMKEED